MIYFIVALFLYLAFQLFRAKIEFNQLTQRLEFALYKVDQALETDPNNANLLCKKASIFQEMQNFPEAIRYYNVALDILEHQEIDQDILNDIYLSIKYNQKPLPWTKGTAIKKNNSYLTYFLIRRFGNKRIKF